MSHKGSFFLEHSCSSNSFLVINPIVEAWENLHICCPNLLVLVSPTHLLHQTSDLKLRTSVIRCSRSPPMNLPCQRRFLERGENGGGREGGRGEGEERRGEGERRRRGEGEGRRGEREGEGRGKGEGGEGEGEREDEEEREWVRGGREEGRERKGEGEEREKTTWPTRDPRIRTLDDG